DMKEEDFLVEILEKTNCDMLFDITNLYINSVNHNYSIDDFINKIPLEKIVQLHFIGGHKSSGVLIDSHSHSTPKEVWAIMEKIAQKTKIKGALLEWDENFPNFDKILYEIEKANTIINYVPKRNTASIS
ncbi:MAG: DUF692 family multinuclear iron-containing protein, partial [Cyanobacteriota bacterium]